MMGHVFLKIYHKAPVCMSCIKTIEPESTRETDIFSRLNAERKNVWFYHISSPGLVLETAWIYCHGGIKGIFWISFFRRRAGLEVS